VRSLIALVFMASLLGWPQPTSAAAGEGSTFVAPQSTDTRPCVSRREFNAASYQQRRDRLEKRWEVSGLGRVASVPPYGRVTIYPRCAYSMREAWYGVYYVKRADGHLWMVGQVWWRKPGARPHGQL
jgi:hypothetical protein